METSVKKWGNSLALRIPKPLAEEIGLEEDSSVWLSVEEGRLVIVPVPGTRYSLKALLDQITADNVHAEVTTGKAVGGEAW
ncbi:MAG: AbrB/MazE/SpoVT family DNA-binding domain-containing protein [Anaerolineae bacterium]